MISDVAAGIAVYTVVVGGIGGLLFGLQFLGGVLIGGALVYFNLLWLASLVKKVLEKTSAPRQFGVNFALKELGLLVAVSVLVALELVEAVPFLVGFSSLAVSVFVCGLRWLFRKDNDKVQSRE